MGLIDVVAPGPVAVDSAVFTYFIEEHPVFLLPVRELFTRADREEVEIVTSAVTLLEVLVAPYRVGNQALATRYEALLTRSRGVRLIEMDRGQLRSAAQLRALHGLRTPDALQLAAALATRCTALITNDPRLPSLPGLRVLQLSELA